MTNGVTEPSATITSPFVIRISSFPSSALKEAVPVCTSTALISQGLNLRRAFAVIPFLTMFGEVETDGLHFLAWPQTNHRLHDESDHDGSHNRQHECETDGLDLFEHQFLCR